MIDFEFILKDDGTYEITKYIGESSEVNIPQLINNKKVTSIGDGSFYECRSLTSVTIPDSVTSIGDAAFYCCYGLRSITIPDSVTSIGESAFCLCDKLIEVLNLSSLVITKGSINNGHVGYNALNIKSSVESDIVNIEDYLFYTYEDTNYLLGYVGKDTELALPDDYNGKIYKIYKNAFAYCNSLSSITIPDSVTGIGEGAFFGCKSLTSITIGNSVTSIEDYAFHECSSLESITIPDSVTSIGEGAFSGCSSLESITIPDSVTSIGNRAFDFCSSLTTIIYKGTIEQWENIRKGTRLGLEKHKYNIKFV